MFFFATFTFVYTLSDNFLEIYKESGNFLEMYKDIITKHYMLLFLLLMLPARPHLLEAMRLSKHCY